MATILVSEEQELYKEFKSDFSNNVDVALYKRKISSRLFIGTLARTIEKKPAVYFFDSNSGEEIKKNKWTPEMKAAAKQYEIEHPVPDAGKKFTGLGKSFIFLTIAGIIAAIVGISYGMFVKTPQNNQGAEQFTSLPKVGDKYYGLISKTNGQAPTFKHGWIKVTNVNAADSTCTYVVSKQLGKMTFNTLEEAEHEQFDTKSYTGRFSSNKEQQQIILISSNKNNRFEASVLNNEFSNYKIPVE